MKKDPMYLSLPATPPARPDLSGWPQYRVTATAHGRRYVSDLRAPNENLALTAAMSLMWEEHGIEPEDEVKYTVRVLHG